MVLCTLFDRNYLERALVLYRSIKKYTDDFTLYMYAFDQKTYSVLQDMELEHAVAVSEEELLADEILRSIKATRTRTEYCWTCTPYIIEHVLDHYKEKDCTYIDADMCFYSDVNQIMDEIREANSAVSIIEHRFPDGFERPVRLQASGRYCVECNTFFNDSRGREVLSYWKQKCTESCTMNLYEEGFGDQKYLSDWNTRFENVHEIQNKGCGVAPWNIRDYQLIRTENDKVLLRYRKKEECELVFYHFQNVTFTDTQVNIGVYSEIGIPDHKLIRLLYMEYLKELLTIRQLLAERYQLYFTAPESRKGKGTWKYNGVRDLLYRVVSLVTIILRYQKNRYQLDEIGE